MTDVTGPPDVQRDVALPSGHTVSGTIRCNSTGLANSYVEAQPHSPLSAGGFLGWGRFAGGDGYYALALQHGIYDFYIDPAGSIFPTRTITNITVAKDLTLNYDYCALFLPIIRKSS